MSWAAMASVSSAAAAAAAVGSTPKRRDGRRGVVRHKVTTPRSAHGCGGAMSAAAASSVSSASAAPSTPRRRDYDALFARGKDGAGCPALFLAPMEGLGDSRLRKALFR